jgi:hypothetical protein
MHALVELREQRVDAFGDKVLEDLDGLLVGELQAEVVLNLQQTSE